ncbi:hypothetical protein MAR_020337 [Mya arenaria]|uniref:UBZ1-type domain-containing protein n=1 Tax=Mya arenaria TaxID=6604 RepID=A0ABY7E4N4_MYAAR|nr:shootin-1-like [Mya arenaria]XP_052804382.1 shootin-1-like [Mya arenaria]XP_052804383.1 shootin-1-like [Mya arenaria]XP_052804385.1 shootin-1-like [Mya arenaria]WAR04968.1 hypothetical protein MAR_020337 [Mya arenaria]
MDQTSDEEIELLGETDENRAFDDADTNLNPLHFLSRCASFDESVNSSSFNALQTACIALQQKLKEKDKKIAEVTNKNKSMNVQLEDYRLRLGMDEFYDVHEPTSTAAGATSGEEKTLAESRANKGLIKHLHREILVRENALTKNQEEIFRLKQELEETRKRFLREKDGLQSSYDVMSHSLIQKEHDCAIKDNEIQNLTECLQKEKQEKDRLTHDLNDLKEHVHKFERNSQISANPSKDAEIHDLRSRLQYLENDKKRLYTELEAVKKERDSLNVKSKQLEIEANIAKQNHSSLRDDHQSLLLLEEMDDVDGDIVTLNKALQMVNSQRKECEELKSKVLEQSDIIHTLTKQYTGGSSSLQPYYKERRSDVPGASFHPTYNDKPHEHEYVNARTLNQTRSDSNLTGLSQSSTGIARRQSDRSDYRMHSSLTRGMPVSGNIMSSRNAIPHMMAQEINQAAPHPNVVDSLSSPRSPRSPRTSRDERRPETEIGDISTQNSSPQNITPLSTYRHPPNYSQVQDVSNSNQLANYREQNSPNRYTPATTTEKATRSVLEPVKPLQIQAQSNHKPRRQPSQERQMYSPRNNESEQRRPQNYQLNIGPDYENVYNPQTENKRQIEEHEEPRFVTCTDNRGPIPVQDEHHNDAISAVKVCPVCSQEFSRMKMEEFQMHVFECFDNCDESPATLQPGASGQEDERVCPMCNETFPLTIPQETYEQHVLGHFGDDPNMERFEMLQN